MKRRREVAVRVVREAVEGSYLMVRCVTTV
jgi:hypothetical protein